MKPQTIDFYPLAQLKTGSGIIYVFFRKTEYISLQYDDSKRDEILDFMRQQFKQKTLEEWGVALNDLDICWGPVRTIDEAMEDQLFIEREMVVELNGADGKSLKCLGVPVKLSGTPDQFVNSRLPLVRIRQRF